MRSLKALVLGECEDIVAPLFIGNQNVLRLTNRSSPEEIKIKIEQNAEYSRTFKLLQEVYKTAQEEHLFLLLILTEAIASKQKAL